MSTMAQIRTTIQLLSNIFRENGCSKIKAETFRQAKFNSAEAAEPMWKLLFELIYYCDNGKIDDICVRATSELLPEELVAFVKRKALSWNYFSRDLADLPSDMSSGSRELLLLLGWMMCREKLISKFIDSRTEALNEDTMHLYREDEQLSLQALTKTFGQKPAEVYDRLQQLVVLNNKLQLNLKSLFALQMEKNVLRHKIHESTQQGSDGQTRLSMLEMYMLQHPELLQKNMELLEKDNERLQNLLKWRDHDDVWWQWMDSVLDAKLAEKSGAAATGDDEAVGDAEANNSRGLLDFTSHLEDMNTDLSATVARYERVLYLVEQLAGSQQVTAEEIDSIISSIDADVAMQETALLAAERQSALSGWMAEPIFELNKQEPIAASSSSLVARRPQLPQASTAVTAMASRLRGDDDLRDIESDLESLRGALSDLQVQMSSEQQQFRHQMEALCGQLDGILCIPQSATGSTGAAYA